jgi:hypothetical protein
MGCTAQKRLDLEKESLMSVNREVAVEGGSISLNAAEGDGMAILKSISFKGGTVQLDIKGEDNPGKSFVGLAFNIQNDSTYEAIYFRPFNFRSGEKIRRQHGIQYIFSPDYSWERLRTEKEGQFEAEFVGPPSPNDWFSVSIKITSGNVVVKDVKSGKTLMRAERLANGLSDKLALWVGNNSNGEFRNLMIKGN